MSEKIERIINAIVAREGGYSNNLNDRGGETMYGITKAVAAANGYHGPMKDMPREVAVGIYRRRYVTEPQFDKIAQWSVPIAEELIDTGVNMGTHRAAEYLQRALNAFNFKNRYPGPLFVDGRIGAQTLNAFAGYLVWRDEDGEAVMLRVLNGVQATSYLSIVEANPSQKEFFYGWIKNRVS